MSIEDVIICNEVLEDTPLMDQIRTTYEESFPIEERREFELIKELYLHEPKFRIYVLFKNESYAGFITVWDFDWFVYIEHFAIDPSARNGGIGGKGFKKLMDVINKPIVLEVELPTDDLSTRRIGFYERLGFKLDHQSYFQPPYRKGEETLLMRLMSYGGIDMEKEFLEIRRTLYHYVYQY